MRVYSRGRTGRGQRLANRDSGSGQQSFMQRIADNMGLGGRANNAGSFIHVMKVDSHDSFDHSQTVGSFSEEEASLKLHKVETKSPVPRVIPFEDEARTPEKQATSWIGVGLDDGVISLCVSEDSSVGDSPITKTSLMGKCSNADEDDKDCLHQVQVVSPTQSKGSVRMYSSVIYHLLF
jgi:hypothetical protein